MTAQNPNNPNLPYNNMGGQTPSISGTMGALYGPNSIVGGQNVPMQNGDFWNPTGGGGIGTSPNPNLATVNSVTGGSPANRTMYGDQPSMTSSPSSAYNSNGYLSNKYTATGGANPLDSKEQQYNYQMQGGYQPQQNQQLYGPMGPPMDMGYQGPSQSAMAGAAGMPGMKDPGYPGSGMAPGQLDQGYLRSPQSGIQQLPNTGSDMYTNTATNPNAYNPQSNTLRQPYSAMPATDPMTQASTITPGSAIPAAPQGQINDPSTTRQIYDVNAGWNAPPPPGWPEGLPAPPEGVIPGTKAFHRWLKKNGISPTSRTTAEIVNQLYMQRRGGGVDPRSLMPWGQEPGSYEQYMQDYLSGLGLGLEDQPDSFRQDLYGQIMGDAQTGAMNAAGMIEDFDPTKAAGFDTLSNYMQKQQGYLDQYGGYMGFDPKPLQASGIAQAEIARARAEDAFKSQFAGSGLLGQANSSYSAAPLYGDYMANRVNAMQQPFNMAAQLGAQGVGTTMGALTDLYGLGQTADVARAGAYSDLYGQGLATGASTALGAGQADQQQFQAMQDLYGRMPMEGYNAAMDANSAWNRYLQDQYAASMGEYHFSEQMDEAERRRRMEHTIAVDQSTQGHASNIISGIGGGMGMGG